MLTVNENIKINIKSNIITVTSDIPSTFQLDQHQHINNDQLSESYSELQNSPVQHSTDPPLPTLDDPQLLIDSCISQVISHIRKKEQIDSGQLALNTDDQQSDPFTVFSEDPLTALLISHKQFSMTAYLASGLISLLHDTYQW
jgi:hypothetical protein